MENAEEFSHYPYNHGRQMRDSFCEWEDNDEKTVTCVIFWMEWWWMMPLSSLSWSRNYDADDDNNNIMNCSRWTGSALLASSWSSDYDYYYSKNVGEDDGYDKGARWRSRNLDEVKASCKIISGRVQCNLVAIPTTTCYFGFGFLWGNRWTRAQIPIFILVHYVRTVGIKNFQEQHKRCEVLECRHVLIE